MASTALVVLGVALAATAVQAQTYTSRCNQTLVSRCDSTCTATGFCATDLTWVLSEACPSGQSCFDASQPAACGPSNGTLCAEQTTGTTPANNITCLSAGTFFSPTDCASYYTCSAAFTNGTVTRCPSGQRYDSCSRACVAGTCTTAANAVTCTGVASEGVDPNNNALHYTCVAGSTTPYWSACPQGQQYSLVDRRCVAFAGCVGCTARGAVAYTASTCQYVWCNGRGNFQLIACSSGFHYDATYRACLPGACA